MALHLSRARVLIYILLALFCAPLAAEGARPNLLLITVDDMNADSVGAFGSSVPSTTPNIDQLARAGLRFEQAHVQVANCTPSRNVMWSGRYPHSNKVEGFYQVREPGYETLSDLVQAAGYFTAVRHKVHSSTPYHPYAWDLDLDETPAGVRHHPRDPATYGKSTAQGIRAAKAAGKPFAIMLNIGDPHVPFYGLNKAGQAAEDLNDPSLVYSADDMVVPGYLVEDAIIRQELSHYYSSVRRADDAVGHILKALDEAEEAGNTLVMFLSDHGMPFPFAKTQLYHHSTWTPLIFRWPGAVKPSTVDNAHMVSAVDILPTLLEAVSVPLPTGIEGRSFLPLLQGNAQDDRDRVFKEYNENSVGQRAPMRAVQTSRFLYIFNPWSDGRRVIGSATRSTRTYARMTALAKADQQLAARLHLLQYRVPEELYDIASDPDCLNNLIDDPAYKPVVAELSSALEAHLRETDDHALTAFVGRNDKAVVAAYMREQDLAKQQQRRFNEAIKASLQKAANKAANEAATVAEDSVEQR